MLNKLYFTTHDNIYKRYSSFKKNVESNLSKEYTVCRLSSGSVSLTFFFSDVFLCGCKRFEVVYFLLDIVVHQHK